MFEEKGPSFIETGVDIFFKELASRFEKLL